MSTTISRHLERDTSNTEPLITTIDLNDVESIRSTKDVISRQWNKQELKEISAGKVAVILVTAFAATAILSILASAIITLAISATQAQAFIATVVTLLDSMAKFGNVVFWPLLLYYFLQEYRNKQ